ncbi:MAG: hypothetical protein KAT52_05540, partial [Desulfobacterales bacterium]|nr:hypothetical protein [Desulfobacterales bacterium]
AAIAIPNFLSYRTKGQDSAAQSEAKNFYNTALAYFADTTTTGTVVGAADEAGGHVHNTDIDLGGGTLTDNLDGTITVTVPLTFSHSGSDTTYTLDSEGNM